LTENVQDQVSCGEISQRCTERDCIGDTHLWPSSVPSQSLT
jgi:hypothetical protein